MKNAECPECGAEAYVDRGECFEADTKDGTERIHVYCESCCYGDRPDQPCVHTEAEASASWNAMVYATESEKITRHLRDAIRSALRAATGWGDSDERYRLLLTGTNIQRVINDLKPKEE